jgi:uncharacterized membrane-anchored protein YjiN (DUF445 family)
MTRVATGLLVLSTLVLIIAHWLQPRYPWLAYVVATAEAAMVGGLADWFAVTALFRHPLGIPVPHTAIIPARKNQVGRSLGGFVQRHFLSPEVVSAKLRTAGVAAYLLDWVAEPDNAKMIAHKAATGLATGIRANEQTEIQQAIANSLARKVERTPVAPLLASALTLVTTDNRHQELFDEVIHLLARTLSKNRDFIRERIDKETPWWMPEQIDEKIAAKIVKGIDRTLQDIRDNPEHPMRERFDNALHEFIERLRMSPHVIERAEQMKRDVLNAEAVHSFASTLWEDLCAAIVRTAENPDARSIDSIARGIVSVAEGVRRDDDLVAKIDGWVIETACYLVEKYRGDVAGIISETVDSWDPDVTSERIELAVGPDLQYIRINGTLVGGLAGLIIYTLLQIFQHGG